MNEQWVLLWSGRQNALHVETVDAMLTSNRKACGEGRSTDFVPFFIGEREVVEAAASRLRPILTERGRRNGLPDADRLAAANRSAA